MMLSKALKVAVKAHSNQVDKGGNPYIYHPAAVANMVESEEEKIVALLHDVVEDSSITLEVIESYGFSDRVLKALKVITKCKGEDYEDYINRVKQDPIACKVKIADLKHNMDLTRIPEPCEEDYVRVEKYKNNIKQLSTY